MKKLISIFEIAGTTYVKDSNGQIYSLQPIEENLLPRLQNLTIETTKNQDEFNLEVKITEMLAELDIPESYKGYQYLITSIMVLINHPEYRENVTKFLYPTVSKMHNVGSVHSGISTLILHSKSDKINKLFPHKRTPSTKDFIFTLTDHFISQYN